MTYASADSHVNVTNISNIENESSICTSSNVQNTAFAENVGPIVESRNDSQAVVNTDYSKPRDAGQSSDDGEQKSNRSSATGSPVSLFEISIQRHTCINVHFFLSVQMIELENCWKV